MRDTIRSFGRTAARGAAILGGLAFGFAILAAKKVNDLLGGPKPR